MRGNFDVCLSLLWQDEPACLGGRNGRTKLGLTTRTVASWRGCLVGQVDPASLEKGEAAAILYAWFWRGVQADDLPPGVDYALFDHAIFAGPKQAVLDLQHVLGRRRADGCMDGFTLRAVENANPRTVIAGLTSFRRDKEHAEAVAEQAVAMASS